MLDHFIRPHRELCKDPERISNPPVSLNEMVDFNCFQVLAAARLLWKIEKAYSLGIPKKNLALGESQTEEEHAYARRYTMFWPNGRSTGT